MLDYVCIINFLFFFLLLIICQKVDADDDAVGWNAVTDTGAADRWSQRIRVVSRSSRLSSVCVQVRIFRPPV